MDGKSMHEKMSFLRETRTETRVAHHPTLSGVRQRTWTLPTAAGMWLVESSHPAHGDAKRYGRYRGPFGIN